MKLKALLLALFTAGFAVSIAVAASPAALENGKPTTGTSSTATTSTETSAKNGHGKGRDHRVACKPARKILLHGTYVAAATGGFVMAIAGGNEPAKAWAGKQATVLVDEHTRVHGAKRSLSTLTAGDRLHVQGYACKADAAAGTVLARKVGVKGPKDGASTTTTTTTTTSATTTGTTTSG